MSVDEVIKYAENAFKQNEDKIASALGKFGHTPSAVNATGIANAIKEMCNARYSDGASSVIVTCVSSGNVITATASNGKSATATIPYSDDDSAIPCSISVDGKIATKSYSEGYYHGGTIDVDASGSRSNGITEGVKSLSAETKVSVEGDASKDGGKYSISASVTAIVKNGRLSWGASMSAVGTGVGYAACSGSASSNYKLDVN